MLTRKVAAPAATIVTLAGGPAARQRAAFALVGRADRRLEAQRPGRDLPRTVRTADSVRRTVEGGHMMQARRKHGSMGWTGGEAASGQRKGYTAINRHPASRLAQCRHRISM